VAIQPWLRNQYPNLAFRFRHPSNHLSGFPSLLEYDGFLVFAEDLP
jgi:hypothetical protein